jgi:lactoylglutathione lyase
MINLRLIVIRTSDIQILSNFYSIIGLEFDYHKHGNSPYHYSTTIEKTVLEIYPL